MNDLQDVEILLVDNFPKDVKMTVEAFKRHGLASRLLVINKGEEALDFIFGRNKYAGRDLRSSPKLILLALKLPDVHGIKVLREIKSDETTKTIPIVILTSSVDSKDLRDAYRLGANSFIAKPLEVEIFLNLLSQVCVYWTVLNKPPL